MTHLPPKPSDTSPEDETNALLPDDAVVEDLLRDVDGLPDDETRSLALRELVRACWASMAAGQRAVVRLAYPPTPRADPQSGPVRATHIDEAASLMCNLKPGWYGVRADGARRGPYEDKGSALTSWAAFGLSVTDCIFQEDPTSEGGYAVYSFNRKHRSFKSPDEVGLGPRDDAGNVTVEDEDLKAKFEAGLAYILSYSEHGLCRWSIGEGVSDWDSTAVAGVMVLDSDYIEHMDAAERRARAELLAEEYTAWSNGEVYEVKFLVNGEEDESGTFYGEKSVKRWLDQVCEHRHIDPKPEIVWPWERSTRRS
jgi:hypothetical protein